MINYLIILLIHQSRSEEIGDSLIENVISIHHIGDYIIVDQDIAFTSSLMHHLFKKLSIKIKTVAPYSQQSLQTEHVIKSLSTILTKHLMGLGQMCPEYLPLATLVYNTFSSPNLTNFSPYESVLTRKQKWF